MVMVAVSLLGAASGFPFPLLEQPVAASGVRASREGSTSLQRFVPKVGGPSSVEGLPGPWPFVLLRALCHWCVSVPVLWLPVPAAEHDAGLRADGHLPACDPAESHRLQGQSEQLPCLPPPPCASRPSPQAPSLPHLGCCLSFFFIHGFCLELFWITKAKSTFHQGTCCVQYRHGKPLSDKPRMRDDPTH